MPTSAVSGQIIWLETLFDGWLLNPVYPADQSGNGGRTVRLRPDFNTNCGGAIHDIVLAGYGIAGLVSFPVGHEISAARFIDLLLDWRTSGETPFTPRYPAGDWHLRRRRL